jgi:predicted neutral ceramidase superfamily lipid hydrolase
VLFRCNDSCNIFHGVFFPGLQHNICSYCVHTFDSSFAGRLKQSRLVFFQSVIILMNICCLSLCYMLFLWDKDFILIVFNVMRFYLFCVNKTKN